MKLRMSRNDGTMLEIEVPDEASSEWALELAYADPEWKSFHERIAMMIEAEEIVTAYGYSPWWYFTACDPELGFAFAAAWEQE